MSISQRRQPIRECASQFETPLGHLDSYDENMMLNQFIWGLQLDLACFVNLQYSESIAQLVSLAETTELAVKTSRRPIGGFSRGQINPIRDEDNGEVYRVVAGDIVVEIVVDPRVKWGALAEEDVVIVALIPWLVTSVGCVAI